MQQSVNYLLNKTHFIHFYYELSASSLKYMFYYRENGEGK